MLLNFVLHGTRRERENSSEFNLHLKCSLDAFICLFSICHLIFTLIEAFYSSSKMDRGIVNKVYRKIESEMLIQLFTVLAVHIPSISKLSSTKARADMRKLPHTQSLSKIARSLLKYRENSNQADELHKISFISPFQLKFRVSLKSSAYVREYYTLETAVLEMFICDINFSVRYIWRWEMFSLFYIHGRRTKQTWSVLAARVNRNCKYGFLRSLDTAAQSEATA